MIVKNTILIVKNTILIVKSTIHADQRRYKQKEETAFIGVICGFN